MNPALVPASQLDECRCGHIRKEHVNGLGACGTDPFARDFLTRQRTQKCATSCQHFAENPR